MEYELEELERAQAPPNRVLNVPSGASASARRAKNKTKKPRLSLSSRSSKTGLKARAAFNKKKRASQLPQTGHKKGCTAPTRAGRKISARSFMPGLGRAPTIHVASDCTGLDSATCALRLAGLHSHPVFMSEKRTCTRRVLLANVQPDAPLGVHGGLSPPQVFSDIMTRAESAVHPNMKVDLYSAGPPCQPYSTAGRKEGLMDAEGRGLVFVKVLQTVRALLPLTFFLENVRALATDMKYRQFFDFVLAFLRDIKDATGNPYYHVEHRVLQTSVEGGLPQNRARLRADCIRLEA